MLLIFRIKEVRWSVFLSRLSTICTAHLINALLLSGIQFRLPTACNVERTQEPTPGTNVLFACCQVCVKYIHRLTYTAQTDTQSPTFYGSLTKNNYLWGICNFKTASKPKMAVFSTEKNCLACELSFQPSLAMSFESAHLPCQIG